MAKLLAMVSQRRRRNGDAQAYWLAFALSRLAAAEVSPRYPEGCLPTTNLINRTEHSLCSAVVDVFEGHHKTYDNSDPYMIQFPRLSYLGLLSQKLHAFFLPNLIYPDVSSADLWLSYEGVPLKWHYPLGLLYDLYSGVEPAYASDSSSPTHRTELSEDDRQRLPWKLTVHFSDYPIEQLVRLDVEDEVMHDLFRNSVKEADYLRTGTGKTVMFLSEKDSTQLWHAVKQHDFSLYNPINQKLLNPQGAVLRHLPVRIYLPHAADSNDQKATSPGSLRVVQSLVTPNLSSRQPQTVGTALNQILPTLFPSRRSPLLAQAVLHGAVLPLSTNVEDLVRAAAPALAWKMINVQDVLQPCDKAATGLTDAHADSMVKTPAGTPSGTFNLTHRMLHGVTSITATPIKSTRGRTLGPTNPTPRSSASIVVSNITIRFQCWRTIEGMSYRRSEEGQQSRPSNGGYWASTMSSLDTRSPEWSDVTDPVERRKIQNKLAQQRFRAKAREQREDTEREAENRLRAANSYRSPDISQLEERHTLSGLPWGGVSFKHIIAVGQDKERSSQQSSQENSVYAMRAGGSNLDCALPIDSFEDLQGGDPLEHSH
ncbi:hypothetical protein OPT61_g2525 [Boeremia exigua]|uniref:Uncharacterized protein n=1 Tax=Boeremia exigua TaxID=749465 RepID=A0ACC2IL78_9PLEO|nr:hypothetical protein OPT61_g2525 [Boeremia exigua]